MTDNTAPDIVERLKQEIFCEEQEALEHGLPMDNSPLLEIYKPALAEIERLRGQGWQDISDVKRREIVKEICERHIVDGECACMKPDGIGFDKVPAAVLCRDTAEEILDLVIARLPTPPEGE